MNDFQAIGDVARRVVDLATGIERHPILDRASWLALRRNDVTASAAGALFGCHEYISAYRLWAEKTGRVAVDGEMTEAMERGIELEPIALKRMARIYPDWKVWNPGEYLRDPKYRLGATPDAYAVSDRGMGVVQIKSVEPSVFRRKWRSEGGEIEPPLWIAVQALIEAALAGASWAAVAALVIGHGIELHLVDIPLNRGLIDRIRAEAAAFWRMVDEGQTPDPDWKLDGRLLEQLYETTGEVVDLSSDNALPALCDERENLSKTKSAAERRLKEIKAEMLAKLGSAAIGRISDGRMITAKRVDRKGYEVAPTSYIDVRIKAGATA